MGNKPNKTFKAGAVRASVFSNTIQHAGKDVAISKVVLEVRYKDKKTGEWKSANSLSMNELPKAILALQMAYQFLSTGRDWQEEFFSTSPVTPGQ